MFSIRSKGTKLEILVRKCLYAHSLWFLPAVQNTFMKADIVCPKYKVAEIRTAWESKWRNEDSRKLSRMDMKKMCEEMPQRRTGLEDEIKKLFNNSRLKS